MTTHSHDQNSPSPVVERGAGGEVSTTDHARQLLSKLWTLAQTLPDDQAQTMSAQLVAVYDDIQGLRQLIEGQASTLQDAHAVFTAMIDELRSQRNNALDDLQSARRTADQQARTDIARDLSMELDCSVPDASRLLNAVIGNPDVPVSGYTMMDLRDTLRRLLEEMTEELVCADPYQPSDL